MSELKLSDIRIRRGVIHAHATGAVRPPRLSIVMDGTALVVAEIEADGADWAMTAPLPMDALSDGARALSIVDQDTQHVLATLPLSLGEAYANDLRAEVEMLRAEMDLLKQAVRRHGREQPE